MTAPFLPAAEQAIRQEVGVHLEAEVTAGATTVPLEVESLSITFDEGWAPHVQARITARVPDDQDDLDFLDARQLRRVVIRAGYRYEDGTLDVHQIASLVLDRRVVTRDAQGGANTMALEASSDERLLEQWAPIGSTRTYATGTVVADVVADIIEWAQPGAAIVNTLNPIYTLLEPLTVNGSSDPWGEIMALVDYAYGWVYHDGNGTWIIRNRPERAGPSVHLLKVGANGTVIRSETSLSREDGYANTVLLRYQDTAGAQVVGVARTTAGPFAPTGGAPIVILDIDRRPLIRTLTAARQSAAAILSRALTRGRAKVLTAVATLWVRPGRTVTVQLPTGGQERDLVSAVTFDFPAATMTVTTRQPVTATITTGE